MAFYRDRVYPKLVHAFGNPKPIEEVRRRILPLAQGDVLEIGFGPGVNLAYYDPRKIRKLYALEPSEAMLRIAARHPDRQAFDIDFLALPGERIPLENSSIDAVVSTFTLCTAPVAGAVSGMVRILKPGGKLIFLENSASPEPTVRRRQQWWGPVARRVFVGLELSRDIPAVIKAGGFQIEHIETGYLASFPKSWTYCCWGTATLDP